MFPVKQRVNNMSSWMKGSERKLCPTTNMSVDMRRQYVAVLHRELRKCVLTPRAKDALDRLVPELGPDGVEPEIED